jgi:hypothetical protein
VSTSEHHLALIQGEPVAQQTGRALTAWLSQDEAAMVLRGGRQPDVGQDLSEVAERLAAARAAVALREPLEPENPIRHLDDRSSLDAAAARTALQAAFAATSWRLEMVDLRKVQSMQKAIKTDGLDDRLAPVLVDHDQLLDFCLPLAQSEPPSSALVDADGKGFTISSLNPNLRIATGQMGKAEVSAGPGQPTQTMAALTLLVFMGTSHIQVAHYHGRYFLRDGYHRSAALLKAGIYEIPSVFIEATTFEEVVGGNPSLFSYEVCFSLRPPLLADFWNDDVADTVLQLAARKVIRVRGEEFHVQG